MIFNSPLRYPGGKGRLSQYICDLMEANGLVGACYAEPYAGGAGVALALLYREYASHILLNDLNRSVHAFWQAAVGDGEELCRRIRACPLNMDEWRRQREIQRADDPDPMDLAFSTLFMNRTNRSGVVKGGVIGGMDQSGTWKLDARFKRDDLIQRIEKIGAYASRITVTGLDALEFLKDRLPAPETPTLVYLDPPYFRKAQKLYDNHYRPADHAVLAEAVGAIQHRWIVSYDNQPEIRELYKNYVQEEFSILYSAGPVAQGSEVMIFGPRISRPRDVSTWRGLAA